MTSNDDTADNDDEGTKMVGGVLDEPAFCLMDGFVDDPKNSNTNAIPTPQVPFRLPINRLPANLGRTHVPTEQAEHFFGLGKTVKALSRLQCRIEYRTNLGLIEPLEDPTRLSSSSAKPTKFIASQIMQQTNTTLHNPKNKDISDPETGFFVITCLGKNPIKVNGQKVEQHESCVLEHGSAVRILAFCLYFLLPESSNNEAGDGDDDDEDNQSVDSSSYPTKTLSIPLPNSLLGNSSAGGAKKRSRHAMETGSSGAAAVTSSDSPVADPAVSSSAIGGKKYNRGNAWTSIQEQLDAMSTDDLLSQLNAALDKGIWDRRCQFIGATVAYRAAREAAYIPELQQAATNGGISKAEVVEWIHNSERFKDWASIMQTKLEPKSYQSSISKAMTRAGYERINNKNFGRHVRWYLPADVHENPNREQIESDAKKTKRRIRRTATTAVDLIAAAVDDDPIDNSNENDEEDEDEDEEGENDENGPEENDDDEEEEEENDDDDDEGAENAGVDENEEDDDSGSSAKANDRDEDGAEDDDESDGDNDTEQENRSLSEQPGEEEEENDDDDEIDDDENEGEEGNNEIANAGSDEESGEDDDMETT